MLNQHLLAVESKMLSLRSHLLVSFIEASIFVCCGMCLSLNLASVPSLEIMNIWRAQFLVCSPTQGQLFIVGVC